MKIVTGPRNFTAPYVPQEFPKWVTLADGSMLIVNDKDEEAAAIGEECADTGTVESLRDALMTEAKALGLKPHHKTGIEKLQQLINDAKS
ncbi:hypothetical protein [Paraburkholderia saeva]|uniref:Uncharacterized protein n=1 Tax=Paraburkholderia saeva TaxID=2777537 RepID=A0A9N8X2E0_9BURK|nr:hypothetical protein [Paraburkholderia saeva]CAG4900766.1 hypothetical protein LMG31841_02915 [Paraburkholderia saeva]